MRTIPRLLSAVLLVTLPFATSGCVWIARATVNTSGAAPNADSFYPALSADARYVTFSSAASDLVAGDNNNLSDVFVRDVQAGTTELVSVDVDGGDANGASDIPSISDDGRYVAFRSFATDLVEGDGNNLLDVFVRDRMTQTTTRISVDTNGGDGNDTSDAAVISGDGSSVVFSSRASDLVPSDNDGASDVFVRDLEAGTTTMIPSSKYGAAYDLSPDGRFLVFSTDTPVFEGDESGNFDAFVYDSELGTLTPVTLNTTGGYANGGGLASAISDDGRFVAFWSSGTALTDVPVSGPGDVFVRDLVEQHTVMVTADANGGAADWGTAGPAALSGDGRYVAFRSEASDLIPGGTGAPPGQHYEVYVRDLQKGTTQLVSANTLGKPGSPKFDYFLQRVSLSGDGRYVAFQHVARGLDGPANGKISIFVRATREPVINAVAPLVVARGTTVSMLITGENFTPDAILRSYTGAAGDVSFSDVTVLSDNEIRAQVSVAQSAPAGPLTFAVIEPGPGPGRVEGSAGLCTATCPTIS